jgi:hypothetical protein
MKAEIAVITVSGKAYYILVKELRKRNLPFLSLTHKDTIPMGVKVILTTRKEETAINHEKILVYEEEMNPGTVINQALQIIRGKESYEKVVIGVDPGEVEGLAVIADGNIIEVANSVGIKGTLQKVQQFIDGLKDVPTTEIEVKVGDGAAKIKQKLLEGLDEMLPQCVRIEVVGEEGTNNSEKHRRGCKHIASAVAIAGRSGRIFSRKKRN